MTQVAARLVVAACVILLIPGSAQALLIENGMYWDPQDPGRGYLIEHQNGQIAMAFYEIDETTGQPVFYVGAGMLHTHAYAVPDYDLLPRAPDSGFFPMHWASLTLVRPSRDGDGGAVSEAAFDVLIYFVYGKRPYVFLYPEPTESSPTPETRRVRLSRFSFGRYIIGPQTSTGELDRTRDHLWLTDLTGDWVFVDQLDPSRDALRFRFRLQHHQVGTGSSIPGMPYTATFVDDSRNARMICRAGYTASNLRNGCELTQNDEPLFGFELLDVNVYRMEGYRGPLPPHDEPVDRRPERVIGVRVELPNVVH